MAPRLPAALLLIATTALAAPGDGPGEGPEPFTCCDSSRVRTIVRSYTEMVEALARDDTKASGHAFALAAGLRTDAGLTAEENAVIEDLRARVDRVKNRGLDPLRTELAEIGRGVVFLALRHEGGSLEVVEAFCPERGPWLQQDTSAPKSPWGGRCARWR